MNQVVLFVAAHPQIHEILLVGGVQCSENLIFELCMNQPLRQLSIFVPTEEQRKKVEKIIEMMQCSHKDILPNSIKLLSEKELANYSPKTSSFALLFDALKNDEELLHFTSLNPAYLAGTLCKNDMNAFKIWESYRKISEEIYIVSCGSGEEILEWKRSCSSDIELSVIFPMYNIAAYLPKCIETTTAWGAEYVEFLFVDDGSPDNCAEIVEDYAKKDSRIKLLRKTNGGCASARQYGLSRAKGRYVGFIDPDDYIDPTMFRKLFARALTGSYEISYCGYNDLYEETGETKEIQDVLGWPYNNGTSDPVLINELITYRRVAIWRGIYSRNMIERSKIHFYEDLRRFDDLPFKVETFAKARSVVAVPEYLYYYRMQRPGQDVSADDERLYVHFQIFKYLDEFIGKCADRTQMDYLQAVKLQTHIWAIQKLQPEFVKEYCTKAREDLNTNFGFWESCYIFKKLLSRKELMVYITLKFGAFQLARCLATLNRKRRNDEKHAIEQLAELQ